MNSQTSPLIVKAFLGLLQTGEIKMHLNQSSVWKNAKLTGQQTLEETIFEDKDYMGCFLELPLFYEELKNQEDEIKTTLQHYCPKLDVNKQTLYIFSQIFLT